MIKHLHRLGAFEAKLLEYQELVGYAPVLAWHPSCLLTKNASQKPPASSDLLMHPQEYEDVKLPETRCFGP